MTYRQTFATSLIISSIFVAGCATSGTQPAAGQRATASAAKGSAIAGLPSDSGWRTSTAGTASAAPDSAVAVAPSAAPMPTIPAGARYTIYCETFSGPDHVQFSTNLRNVLMANAKAKDWYVIHQAGQSSLYHGYYAEFDVNNAVGDASMARDAQRAQNDHKLVGSLPNPSDSSRKLFPRSLFVPLDSPDPDSPPAWNLTNAPGFWTVQIAAYNGPERKRAAVESVRDARAMNIPAYYYHGQNISSVCIGSWDRSAVQEQNVAVAGRRDFEDGDGAQVVSDDRGARDDGSEFMVNYSGRPMTMKDAGGNDIRVLTAKVNVQDSSLLAVLKEYPAHAVNGEVQMLEGIDRRTQKKVRQPRPSLIVQIPRADRAETAGTTASPVGREPETILVNPGGDRQDLNSRLRGIGR